MANEWILNRTELVLVTGANGYVGIKVVEKLLGYGFKRLRCFIRSTRNLASLQRLAHATDIQLEIMEGNLLSQDDCQRAADGVSLILHIAAGTSKSFAGCFMDSAVATRNLLEAASKISTLKRFLNVSSLAVHSGFNLKRGSLLDETSAIESEHMERYDPYAYGKIKQDEIVLSYGREHGIPFAILRPGPVYGPGKRKLAGRVGIDTFGIFLHLGGANPLPLIYLDNCADAIVLSGIVRGIEGEVFIAVDDELPTSRQFLRLYKKHAVHFFSIYVPYSIFYLFNCLWAKYSKWSGGQLPPAFNPRNCAAYYQRQRYSNRKLKERTGWVPRVSFAEGSKRYFDFVKAGENSQ
jgi:nucleoside-diphosphate-sugar epimerase